MTRESSTRRRLLQVAGTATLVGIAGCGGNTETDTPIEETPTPTEEETPTPDERVSFTVRIENTAPTDFYGSDAATGGQIWVTPGAFAVHTEETNPIFTVGEAASTGLEALAEAGPLTGFPNQSGLVDELPQADSVVRSRAYLPPDTAEDPNDPMGEVPGAPPIAPGGAFEFEIAAEPGQRFSFASMYVPSNDLFLAPESGFEPFDDGEPIDGEADAGVGLWDAGTELNGRPGVSPTGAPLQRQNGGPTIGATEGVVQPLSAVDDGFRYADASDAIGVQLTPEGDGQFTLRIENAAPTDFYGSDTATGGRIWITPGAFAVHAGENPIFTPGEPASVGLEAQAEAGPPTGFPNQSGLVDELPQADSVVRSRAYLPPDTAEDPNDPMGEAPGAPPIAPDGAFEVSLEAEPGDRLSFATMYVPSNDVFFSPRPAIPLYDENDDPVEGDVTSNVALWDAGTELNGQPGVDPTGAPLQQRNGGRAVGTSEGVVRPVNEITDAYEYADPSDVLRVTLTPR